PDVVKFINFNPMYHYVTYFRDIITGTVPSALTHLIIYGMGIFCFGVGWLVFSLSKKKFILYI
ncbi:MAG: ABC transporter permease, partial [Clostridiales bacterium]|nr:ABC transporter permease [Clostridiales bacterium]